MSGIYIYSNNNIRKKLRLSLKFIKIFCKVENFLIKNNDWLTENNLDKGKDFLINKTSNSTISSWCRYEIPPDYIKDIIEEDTNLILLLTDSRDTVRGMALLKVKDTDMILHILCSNMLPNVKTRGNIDYGSGRMLVKMIKFLGKNLINGIQVYALKGVITFYYKFGWRFITHYKGKERSHISNAVNNLYKYYKKNKHRLGDIQTEELRKILLAFRGKAKDRARYIRTGNAIKKEATEEARDDGYEMRLCQNMNKYSNFIIIKRH
tara:strand:+ start:1736 stop:2530 length:795 start_codon:yes stop_codon:yes gene_type:complete